MRKLKLEIEELKVETFVAGGGAAAGTVHGAEDTQFGGPCLEPYDDSINYCSPAPTVAVTCPASCAYTCGCVPATAGQWTCNVVQCYGSEPYVE